MSRTIRTMPSPAAVMLSGGRSRRQDPGSAREAGERPPGGAPNPAAASPSLTKPQFPRTPAGYALLMPEQTTRDMKIVQYLNEAYGKEKELETALEAHISMTTKPAYKKRLRDHLKETKGHARTVERRIKQLGGEPAGEPAG